MRFTEPGYELAREGVSTDQPFRHCVFGETSLLDAAAVQRLMATFPGENLGVESTRLAGGDKSYHVTNLPVYDRGRWQVALTDFDPAWQQLLTYLVSAEYAASMAAALDLGSGWFDVEVRITSYSAGGWMSRHTDRPEKAFSHNVYLCPGWQPDWGGTLALYADAETTEPAKVFVPGAGTSLAFARSDDSWHEVLAVSERAERPRRAVLVHGYHRAGAG